MPTKLHSINLLKNKDVDFLNEFIKWTLTIGRLVVIITELIALSAFIYRFSLDRRLIDLRSEIKQKQTIVVAQRSNEAKYRDLQDRISIASNLSNLSQERHKILTDILNLTPVDITLNNLVLGKDTINIDANVSTVPSLALFINSLKNYQGIEAISIDNIENRQQTNFIIVNVTATVKKSQFDIEESPQEENLTQTELPPAEVIQ